LHLNLKRKKGRRFKKIWEKRSQGTFITDVPHSAPIYLRGQFRSRFRKCLPILVISALLWAINILGAGEGWSKEKEKAVEILSHNTPSTIIFDFPYNVSVTILNNDRLWPKDGKIKLSYHLLDTNGKLVAFEFDRTRMPRNVKKGEIVELGAPVYIPKGKIKPGKYILQWDIVEEGVKWYYAKSLVNKSDALVNIIAKDLYGKQTHPGFIGFIQFLMGLIVVLFLPGILLAVIFIPKFGNFSLTQRFIFSCIYGFVYCNIISIAFSVFSWPLTSSLYIGLICVSYLLGLLCYVKKTGFASLLCHSKQGVKRIATARQVMIFLFREGVSLAPAGLAAVLILSIWQDYITFPNLFDLTSHASFTRKIYDGGLSLGSQIYGPEVPWTIPGKGFYPLGLQRVVAMVAQLSGLNPVFALFYFIIFLIFCAPVTLQIFVQNYYSSLVHMFLIGLSAALYTIFPYEPVSWGGVPLIAATVLMPVLLCIVQYFIEKPSLKLAFGIGLLSTAIFSTHPTELYTVAIISIFLLIRYFVILSDGNLIRQNGIKVLLFGSVAVCILFIVLLPELRAIVYTQMVRAGEGFVRVPDHWPLKLLFLKLHLWPLDVSTVLLYLGVGYIIFTKKFRVLLGIALFFIGITLIENYVNTPFGNLWNHRVARVYYNSYLFNPILIGSGLYLIYRMLQYKDNYFIHRFKSAVLFVLIAFLIFCKPEYDVIKRQLDGYFKRASGMTAEDYDAVMWLRENAKEFPVTVLNQHGDSSFWIYPLTGIPIFWHRTNVSLPYPDTISRVKLQQHVAGGDLSLLKSYASKYGLKYVYISKNVVPLENSPYKRFSSKVFDDNKKLFRLVFSNQMVRIYEIMI